MSALPYRLVRRVLINAERATVFRFFTDSALFAAWWGAGSTIDPRPGGRVVIHCPNAVTASGNVESITPDHSIVFTYGYEDATRGMPPGSTRVTVTLSDSDDGTALELTHDLADEKLRHQHDPGWRYQLSLFANVAAREQYAGVASLVDRWFAAWNEARPGERSTLLGAITEPAVSFSDAFAAVVGIDDLQEHIGAVHVHMPGVALSRTGEPRQCQGGRARGLDCGARRSADGSRHQLFRALSAWADPQSHRVLEPLKSQSAYEPLGFSNELLAARIQCEAGDWARSHE